MAGEIKISAALHRKAYQVLPTPQQAYLMLEVCPVVEVPREKAQAVNLCLVLDRSGSMAGEKLSFLKEAAHLVVDRLDQQDWLSIIIFDDSEPAELILPGAPVMDRERIFRKIDAIQERGGTHMSTGMRLGLQELRRGISPERVSRMLLLTDGQTWEDQADCRALADESRKTGIPMHILGMGIGSGSDWDPRLLEDLAQLSGGEWIAIDSPENVVPVFEKALQSLQATAITNAHLTLRMAEGVSARSVWRVTPMISRLGEQTISAYDIQVFMGDIHEEAGQSVLVDLLIPDAKAGEHRLLQVEVTYDVPGSGLRGQKAIQDVNVPYTDDVALSEQMDGRLMNIIERVVAHKLQTQALDEAAIGDVAKATRRLRAAATRLLELGEVSMAEQANLEAEKIEQSGKIDLASAQKMRFATKRLTESELED